MIELDSLVGAPISPERKREYQIKTIKRELLKAGWYEVKPNWWTNSNLIWTEREVLEIEKAHQTLVKMERRTGK